MQSFEFSMKYKCPYCGNRYVKMPPEGKCWNCEIPLVDIIMSLSVANIEWIEETFGQFPCVIAHEYERLYNLCKADNIFGAVLQLKDVVEATIKFVVLTVAAWGKYYRIAPF